MTSSTQTARTNEFPAHVLQTNVQALQGMRFGQVTVFVQDGRVIQIDRTERHRFTAKKEQQS